MGKNKKLFIFLVLLLLLCGCDIKSNNSSSYTTGQNNMNKNEEKIIRLPAVSGSFYPSDKNELGTMINNFLNNTENKNYKNIRAIVSPHAGMIYSGQTASYGFKQLENQNIEKVIIIGPVHSEYIDNFGLSHADYWRTPLGDIEIDKEINFELEKNAIFEFTDLALEEEHSQEVQIPFLQVVIANNWKLVPILVGQVNSEEIISASKIISKLLDDKTIIVISTDLSHYYKKVIANEMDKKCLESIKNLKYNEECEACGEIPLKLLFEIAKNNNWESEVLHYSDSGEITGDKNVVGYASAIFTGDLSTEASTKVEEIKNSNYSNEDKKYLLNLARNTIDYALKNNGELMKVDEDKIPKNLKQKRGVFVTLNKYDKLRGCIGYIEAIEKLYKAVQLNAISAAFEDTRFSPLSQDELKDIKIEISVLTVPQKVEFDEIRKDIDGVVLKNGKYGATYLPQVWENVTDADEFFGSLCQKAGLDWNCYEDNDTKFFTYQVEVFSE